MKNYEKRNKNKNKNNKKQWKATKNSEKQWQAMTSYEKRWKTDGLAVVLWWFVDERMDGRTDKRTKKRHTSLLTKIRVQPTQSLDMFVPKPTPSLTKVICICDLPLGMASLYLSFSLIYIQLSCSLISPQKIVIPNNCTFWQEMVGLWGCSHITSAAGGGEGVWQMVRKKEIMGTENVD